LASTAVLLLAFAISLKVLLLVLLGVGAYLALGSRHSAVKRLTYLVILLGLAVAFGVEVIYVRDFLDNSDWERMNTVFKFYYQVWTLLSLGGILALTRVRSWQTSLRARLFTRIHVPWSGRAFCAAARASSGCWHLRDCSLGR